MFEEVNTRTNLPAQIEIYAEGEDSLQVPVRRQGRRLGQQDLPLPGDAALLTQDRLMAFLKEKILTLGTAACPPYHLAIVIGGTQRRADAEDRQARLDALPRRAADPRLGPGHAFRDLAMEAEVHTLTQTLGIGAQFGGKYFCHDVRVIRLPRHGASLPIGIGVSCSADRQALGKITSEGVFLEELEPTRRIPAGDRPGGARRRGRASSTSTGPWPGSSARCPGTRSAPACRSPAR